MSAIGGVDPATLLPDAAAAASPDFYSYAGSLTQPPCHESVLWISFIDPITFSQVCAVFFCPSVRKHFAFTNFSTHEERLMSRKRLAFYLRLTKNEVV